jgi:hypothetical protein
MVKVQFGRKYSIYLFLNWEDPEQNWQNLHNWVEFQAVELAFDRQFSVLCETFE